MNKNTEMIKELRGEVHFLRDCPANILSGVVANMDKKMILKIAYSAYRKRGPYENLSVKNAKTKRVAFERIVGKKLAGKVFENPLAIGPAYGLAHYIQSNVYGSGRTEKEERELRRLKEQHYTVIGSDFTFPESTK